jgi:outer membrane protein assembly factor BamD (BamD/ComL family)
VQENIIAEVGKTKISQADFESFQNVMRNYPTMLNDYFPSNRKEVTHLIETQAIFAKTKTDFATGNIKNSKDWQWKKMFYSAQLFVQNELMVNFGITDKEINDYYIANPDTFTMTQKDSTGKDSTWTRPLVEVKDLIIQKLFPEKYKPDAAFYKRYPDSLPNQQVINKDWYASVRANIPAFFMKQYYTEKNNKPYPDSINQIFGKDNLITPEDMDIILSWVPAERRENFSTPEGQKELVEWLLKWKLFSEKAAETGYSAKPDMLKFMDWAWKIEVANEYVKSKLIPAAESVTPIDSVMATYAVYDVIGNADQPLNPEMVTEQRNSLLKTKKAQFIDSLIYNIRASSKVTFLQKDISDSKDKSPSQLLAQADSLRDSSKTSEAEQIYNSLIADFSFLPEGKTALVELAKIQTEQQQYYPAINNYRKYLLSNVDDSKKCNTFFMIGFIFDEYLENSSLAEINYKWLLKNSPECELADDAEFMMLHLNEPMTSVEELQAEAVRQNRKADIADNTAVKTE